jgi:hypothetical protein
MEAFTFIHVCVGNSQTVLEHMYVHVALFIPDACIHAAFSEREEGKGQRAKVDTFPVPQLHNRVQPRLSKPFWPHREIESSDNIDHAQTTPTNSIVHA